MIMGLLIRRTFNVVTLCKRNLFSEKFLGIDSFRKKRNKELKSLDAGRKIQIIREICEDPSKTATSHHVRQIPYILEAKDVELAVKLIEKFCKSSSNRKIVFRDYTQGPETMRLFYLWNMPVEGMELILNPVTSHLFDEGKSYEIIQDLLYNNRMYDEVCNLFRINTSERYNEAMEIFHEFYNYCKRPLWPITMYTLMMALENGAPELALKHPLGADDVSVNIKLAALIKTGDMSKAHQYFNNIQDKSLVIKSLASELHGGLENLQKDGSSTIFQDKTLEELAAKKIESLPPKFV